MSECYGSRVDDYETINAVQLEPGENDAVKAAALPWGWALNEIEAMCANI